jgi:hypothetical protein
MSVFSPNALQLYAFFLNSWHLIYCLFMNRLRIFIQIASPLLFLLRPIRITTEVINVGARGQSVVYKSMDLISPRSISPHCRLWATFISMRTLEIQTKITSDSVTVDYHCCMLKVIGNENNYIYIRYKLNITILQQ